jgi:hypothetical protein
MNSPLAGSELNLERDKRRRPNRRASEVVEGSRAGKQRTNRAANFLQVNVISWMPIAIRARHVIKEAKGDPPSAVPMLYQGIF